MKKKNNIYLKLLTHYATSSMYIVQGQLQNIQGKQANVFFSGQ